MESFSKFYGFFLLNVFWIHSLSFISIHIAIALAPIICFLDQNTCFLTEFSASFYWFPPCPLCSPLIKLFLYCMNQYMSLCCLKPFVGLCLLSWKWYQLHFLVCEAFMVCLLATHPSSLISWHVFLIFHLTPYIIVTYGFLCTVVGYASLPLLHITSSTEVNLWWLRANYLGCMRTAVIYT